MILDCQIAPGGKAALALSCHETWGHASAFKRRPSLLSPLSVVELVAVLAATLLAGVAEGVLLVAGFVDEVVVKLLINDVAEPPPEP